MRRDRDNRDPDLYADENGRYAMRLYHHVVLNVLLYTVAHEAGHLVLRHTEEVGTLVSVSARSKQTGSR